MHKSWLWPDGHQDYISAVRQVSLGLDFEVDQVQEQLNRLLGNRLISG